MILIFFTILVVSLVIFYLYLKNKYGYFKNLNIPHVPPPLILGNFGTAILQKRHLYDVLRDIYQVNNQALYVGLYDLMKPVILIRDVDLMKTVCIKKFDHFTDRTGFVDPSVDPLFGLNLLQINGEAWREARNLLSPAFTGKKMKAMFDLMTKCAENLIDHLDKMFSSKRQMIDTKDLLTKYTNDVIATCAFGLSINSLENPTNQFYVYGRETTDFEGSLFFKFFMGRSLPYVMKLFRVKIVSDKVKDYFQETIRKTIETRDAKGISRPDMLQLMMDARGNMSEHLKLDLEIMTAQCFIFFFAGLDTASTQMCSIVHELASRPEIQQKLQVEIDEARVKCGGQWTYEVMNDLPYLDAVFKESARLHPPVGFTERQCTKSYELPPALPGLKPYVVQPGESIYFPVCALHRDENLFEDAENFKPERHLEKNNSSSNNWVFGLGPRGCIGNRFAILETKILLCYVLSKYNFRPNAKTRIPFNYSKKSFFPIPEGGYWVAAEKRE